MEAYQDPENELNSSKYHTGNIFIIRGCGNQAGTAWSPYFCQKCNSERMNRISASFNSLIEELKDNP